MKKFKNLLFMIVALVATLMSCSHHSEKAEKPEREVILNVSSFGTEMSQSFTAEESSSIKDGITVNADKYGAPGGVPSLFIDIIDDIEGDTYHNYQFDFDETNNQPNDSKIKAMFRYDSSTLNAYAYQNEEMGKSEYNTGDDNLFGYIYHEPYDGNNSDGSVTDKNFNVVNGKQVHELLGGIFYKHFKYEGKVVVSDDTIMGDEFKMKPINDMLAIDAYNETKKFKLGYRIVKNKVPFSANAKKVLSSYFWCDEGKNTRNITVFNLKDFVKNPDEDNNGISLEIVVAKQRNGKIINTYVVDAPSFVGQQTWIKSVKLLKGYKGKEFLLDVSFDESWRDRVWDDDIRYDW